MRYSILTRFQGGLLGSVVGEILGSTVLGQSSDQAITLPKLGDDPVSQPVLDWSRIADCGIESLIRWGRLDLDDWVFQTGVMQPSLLSLKAAASSSEAALATLPIALFFHDDQAKLQQHLQQAAVVWQRESEALEGILAVALAIALSLTERLDVATLIPQILSYLGTSQTPLIQQLELVQTLLEKGVGLDTTLAQLRRMRSRSSQLGECPALSIALAFYCFLYTPEDFRLSVLRAARTSPHPQITIALTGTLSGVYNSLIGIPVGWQVVANRSPIGIQRLQLADHLLATWSGFYDISTVQLYQPLAVAAPRVIQPR